MARGSDEVKIFDTLSMACEGGHEEMDVANVCPNVPTAKDHCSAPNGRLGNAPRALVSTETQLLQQYTERKQHTKNVRAPATEP